MTELSNTASATGPARPKRILLLMATAGGGHKSAALSLAEALTARYGQGIIIDMVDVLKEYAPQPFDRMPEAYQLMIKSPTAWKSFYELGDGVRRSKMINSSLALYFRRQSERLLDNHPADLIISTYHFANSPILETLHRRQAKTAFVTVVTDLVTAPPIWFDAKTTLCITPTQFTADLALKSGLEPSTIKVIGLPVSGKFGPPTRPKSPLKAALGWNPQRPAIIAMAGGEGIGSLGQIADVLTTLDATVAIITGKNTHLLDKLQASGAPDNLKPYGFIHNIHELMQAADLVVTKAGPGTIMEALNTHLPLVIYARLSGQEDGNVTFVTDNGAGIWQPKISALAATIEAILDEPGALQTMASAAAALAQTGASEKIAAIIGDLLDDQP